MTAFTAAQLSSIANAALDFHFKGKVLPQAIQDKPMLVKLEGARKTFPGGKGDITRPMKGKYAFEGAGPIMDGDLTGYTTDDTVKYGTLAGIERARYPWREVHTGWSVTLTELKIDGITVTDSINMKETSEHKGRDLTAITNIMQDKVETFSEIMTKQLNTMLWGDGTADALGFLGIRYFITATPATGTTGGLDRGTNAWWRNRYRLVNTTTEQLPEVFNTEIRQLRRYGGRPDLFVCGSDFLDALIAHLRSKGYYTDAGWNAKQATEIGIADVTFKGIPFMYDPTLDDLGLAKRCYVIDSRRLYLYSMDKEWGKDHNPTRPYDKYAVFKARTFTGQLCCDQLNAQGLVAIA